MSESLDLPNIPGYISIKEAAKILGRAERTIYGYIESGRLPSYRAGNVIMIAIEEIEKFQLDPSGRPRKNTPLWRIASGDNTQFATQILVPILAGQRGTLKQKLEQIRKSAQHIFPGTVTRMVIESKTYPGQAMILLAWRGAVMPNEAEREAALEAFRQELADVLDWESAVYDEGTVLMHT